MTAIACGSHQPVQKIYPKDSAGDKSRNMGEPQGIRAARLRFCDRWRGFIYCAGRHLTADAPTYLPDGLGTRHSSVAAITAVTNAIGVAVSQSGGGIRIIKKGRIEAKI